MSPDIVDNQVTVTHSGFPYFFRNIIEQKNMQYFVNMSFNFSREIDARWKRRTERLQPTIHLCFQFLYKGNYCSSEFFSARPLERRVLAGLIPIC